MVFVRFLFCQRRAQSRLYKEEHVQLTQELERRLSAVISAAKADEEPPQGGGGCSCSS